MTPEASRSPAPEEVVVGVDVGGTSIRAATITRSGVVGNRVRRPTPAQSREPGEVLDAIIATGSQARSMAENVGLNVVGFGFGVPAPCEGCSWIPRGIYTIAALEGQELRPALTQAFGENIAVDMDTHAAMKGVLHFGAYGPGTRMLLMCVGTGISCGVAVDGRVLRYTPGGTCGETGHVIVDPSCPNRCPCGGRGCLESLASGPALERAAELARRAGQPRPSVAELVQLAREKDGVALRVFSDAGRYIGIGLASLMHIYCPQVILLGGGVMEAGEFILPSVRESLDEYGSPFFLEQVREVKVVETGSDLGVMGAASLIYGKAAS